MPDNPNKPDTPAGPPEHAASYMAALYAAESPLRPIEIHEFATGDTVPPAERGGKGRSVAADLKALVANGEVMAVWSEHYADKAVRYGLTAAGRNTGRDEHAKNPPKGKRPPQAKIR